MKLYEYQAKEILSRYQIPVPRGEVAETAEKAIQIAKSIGLPVAIKAQVHVGGRSKAGGIKIAKTEEEATEFSRQILEMKIKDLTVKKVLIEQALDIDREYYLGITVDRTNKCNTLMFSTLGGVDIEEVARTQPEQIVKIPITKSQLPNKSQLSNFQTPNQIIKALIEIYFSIDATLVEINPLVKTKSGKFIAADAKIVIDDNALFRHPDLTTLAEAAEEDEIEAEAHRRKIAYVRLSGEIGIIGNGAGLVMSTMDEVKRAGGTPASFLDIGGGARTDLVKNALEILSLDKNIKGIFMNVFGGITRCDEVVKGIMEASQKIGIKVPMVIRLTGTREEEGRKLLAQTNLIPAATMQEGAKRISELVYGT